MYKILAIHIHSRGPLYVGHVHTKGLARFDFGCYFPFWLIVVLTQGLNRNLDSVMKVTSMKSAKLAGHCKLIKIIPTLGLCDTYFIHKMMR